MPNPYFNNQRTFIPNTLVKSDEVNSQFNDVENGFDLIDELVQEVQADVQQIVAQTTTNTTQITQIINGEIPVGGGGGGGGNLPDPGGVGGDPLAESQLPVGAYAYMDIRAATPTNHVTVSQPTPLSASLYPELAQVVPPSDGFIDDLEFQRIAVPSGIFVPLPNRKPVARDGHLFISGYGADNILLVFVYTKVDGQWGLRSTISTGLSISILNSYGGFKIQDYRFGKLVVWFQGYINKVGAAVPNETSPGRSRLLVYSGSQSNWVLESDIPNPTQTSNYQQGILATSNFNGQVRTFDRWGEFAAVVGDPLNPTVAYSDRYFWNELPNTYGRIYNEFANIFLELPANVAAFEDGRSLGLYGYKDGLLIYLYNSVGYAQDTARLNFISDTNFDVALLTSHGFTPNQRLFEIRSLQVSNDGEIAVGDGAHDETEGQDIGKVLVIRDLLNPALTQIILSPNKQAFIQFGGLLAIEGDVLVVMQYGTFFGDNVYYKYKRVGGFGGEFVFDASSKNPIADNQLTEFYPTTTSGDVIRPSEVNGYSFIFYQQYPNSIGVSPLPVSVKKKTILRVR